MHDSDEERVLETQPEGRLDPPRRNPPTAVGAATPLPDDDARRPAEPREPARRGRRREASALRVAGRLLGAVLSELRRGVRRARRSVRR